jgi:transposase
MSTRLLYHAFGILGYEYMRTEYRGGHVIFTIEKTQDPAVCSLKAVAMDMSPAYLAAASTHLPEATIVFDHFHVMKLFNDRLCDLRRGLYHRATDEQKGVLKGVRWRLLKLPENLDAERNEKVRLKAALRLNKSGLGTQCRSQARGSMP